MTKNLDFILQKYLNSEIYLWQRGHKQLSISPLQHGLFGRGEKTTFMEKIMNFKHCKEKSMTDFLLYVFESGCI